MVRRCETSPVFTGLFALRDRDTVGLGGTRESPWIGGSGQEPQGFGTTGRDGIGESRDAFGSGSPTLGHGRRVGSGPVGSLWYLLLNAHPGSRPAAPSIASDGAALFCVPVMR